LAAYAEYAAGRSAGDVLRLVDEVAARLALRAPELPWHGIRTPVADLAGALMFTSGVLGKFALDVRVLTRTEIDEVREPSGAGRGVSSAMPQKRNPVYATLISAAARQVPATGLILFQSVVVEDERSSGGWHAEWQPLRDCLRLTLGAARNAAALAEGLEVDRDRMRENLGRTGGGVVAERVGAALAPVVGTVEAKRLVGALTVGQVRSAEELAEVLCLELAESGYSVDESWVVELLRPEGYLGASGMLVDRAVGRWARNQAVDTVI
jgi:3-carboxy-cis,cis-muconate cycloisomerase